jgi:hypothetical protein
VLVATAERTITWMYRSSPDADFGPANDELGRARDDGASLDSPINRAQLEVWQSAVHLCAGEWAAAEAAARRSLEDSATTEFDVLATSCLCHARLQLGDPSSALRLAEGHPERNRDSPHGNLLGIVAAIARVQRGDPDQGLADMAGIQRRARWAPFAIQQDDAAVTIAYMAHLLGHDDLTVQILETGVLGYGPWVAHLALAMCRDMGTPLVGHVSQSVEESRARSDSYGVAASRVLDELVRR